MTFSKLLIFSFFILFYSDSFAQSQIRISSPNRFFQGGMPFEPGRPMPFRPIAGRPLPGQRPGQPLPTQPSLVGSHNMRPGVGFRRGNEDSRHVDHLQTGEASFTGNGCPANSMRVAFAPDNLSFSVLFDQFVDEIKPGSGFNHSDMLCNVIVPVQIPQGMQMEITRVDFRGFTNLPAGSTAHLFSIINFRSRFNIGSALNLNYNFVGPSTDNFEISSDDLSTQSVNSSERPVSICGGDTQLVLSNRIRVVSQATTEDVAIGLDSIDGAAHAIYFVKWSPCSPRPMGMPRPEGLGD